MFTSNAYAMAANGAQQGGEAGISQVVMLLAMFAIFYLLLIRPQQKRANVCPMQILIVYRSLRLV